MKINTNMTENTLERNMSIEITDDKIWQVLTIDNYQFAVIYDKSEFASFLQGDDFLANELHDQFLRYANWYFEENSHIVMPYEYIKRNFISESETRRITQ